MGGAGGKEARFPRRGKRTARWLQGRGAEEELLPVGAGSAPGLPVAPVREGVQEGPAAENRVTG